MKTLKLILIAIWGFSQTSIGQSTREIINSPRTSIGKIYIDTNGNYTLDSISEMVSIPHKLIVGIKSGEDRSTRDMAPSASARKYKVFFQAYNPLHYSINARTIIVEDTSSGIIADGLITIYSVAKVLEPRRETLETENSCYSILESEFSDLLGEELKMLKDNKSHNGGMLLKSLVNLKFEDKGSTMQELKRIGQKLNTYLAEINAVISELKNGKVELDKKLKEETEESKCWSQLYVIDDFLDAKIHEANEQKKALNDCHRILSKMNEVIKEWETSEEYRSQWYVQLEAGYVSKKNGEKVDLTFSKHRTSIDKSGDLKQEKDKMEWKKSVHFIWNRMFVPEVSTGVFYSFQESSDYLMDESNGVSEIVRIGQNDFEKMTLSTMINFNLNCRDWPVLPFGQIGVGMQGKLPLVMIGLGARFGLNEQTIAFSGGVSITGIEGLSSLSVGDVITDNVEIQRDLKYEFSGFKPYCGIQYNF